MTQTASMQSLGKEFNPFLHATIGEDKNGMVLSVLSALARRDMDPWQEAAKLASMPEETATQRLMALIEALPKGMSLLDPRATASRLVQLLPKSGKAGSAPGQSANGIGLSRQSSILLYVIILTVMLGSQLIAANRQPRAPIQGASGQASNPATQQKLPPSSGD